MIYLPDPSFICSCSAYLELDQDVPLLCPSAIAIFVVGHDLVSVLAGIKMPERKTYLLLGVTIDTGATCLKTMPYDNTPARQAHAIPSCDMLSSAREPHAEMGSLADSDDEPDTLTAYGDISLTADYEAPAPSLAKPSLRPKRRRPPAPSKLRKAQRYDSEAIRLSQTVLSQTRTKPDALISDADDLDALIRTFEQARMSRPKAPQEQENDPPWTKHASSNGKTQGPSTASVRQPFAIHNGRSNLVNSACHNGYTR